MMKTHNYKSMNQKGFTIVELMIATLVFSLVLLVCAFAIMHVGRMYYKGMIMNRAQDTSRKVIDDVSQAIQFGGISGETRQFFRSNSTVYGTGEAAVQVDSLCLGVVRYSFSTEKSRGSSEGQIPHVLWKDRVNPADAECMPADITKADLNTPQGAELLGENMRLPIFTVSEDNGNWSLSMRLSYGDDPLLFEDDTNYGVCKGALSGGQFCAVSQFNTVVHKRL